MLAKFQNIIIITFQQKDTADEQRTQDILTFNFQLVGRQVLLPEKKHCQHRQVVPI